MEKVIFKETSERRTRERYQYSIDIILQELSGDSVADGSAKQILGQVDNVSKRGLCVSSPVPLMLSKVVRCDIGLRDLPVTVPTIAQVRWVEKINPRNYRCGLQYVL